MMAAPTLPGFGAAKKPKDLEWVAGLRTVTRSIQDKDLWDCNPDELLVIARYHALEFSNCAKDERRNKRAAQRIRSGLPNLAREAKKRWDRYRVRDYVADARRVWSDGGEAPFYRPWDIVGVWDIGAL